jgi:hypothetical protein
MTQHTDATAIQHLSLDQVARATMLPQEWIEQIIKAIRLRPVPLVGDDGDVVLTFREWCELAGLSQRTAQELRARGEGPRCTPPQRLFAGIDKTER